MTTNPRRFANVIPATRGSHVHFAHVATDGTDDGKVRGTSCGRPVRSTWTVAFDDLDFVARRVTCPTCHQWAQHWAEMAEHRRRA